MPRPFRQVDVFSHIPFSGNPVAVVGEAEGLTDEQMRAISRWTNLSECTFLLPPSAEDADYRVRIFSLDTELPFAGHPTLGTARAWLDLGGVPRQAGMITQECGVGLVTIRQTDDRLAFQAPPLIRSDALDPAHQEQLRRTLQLEDAQLIDARWTDNGPGWVAVLVDSVETLRRISPDSTVIDSNEEKHIGVVALGESGQETDVELRAFFPDDTGSLREDPVTGSLNASVAQWLTSTERLWAPYIAEQGGCMQRKGRIFVDTDGTHLWIGGDTTIPVSGTLTL